MNKNSYRVLGMMSGTSLDGIDLALCSFDYNGHWKFTIVEGSTLPYPPAWVDKLKNLVHLSQMELSQLDLEYSTYVGKVIRQFIDEHQIRNLDAVCMHGHTALHQPHLGLTYQIGNLPMVADIIGLPVVCDFRVEDVALGGQGAPLVPIGDELLFSHYDFCLNLGGFANISTSIGGKTVAYDVCAVNTVLNHYAQQLGHEYDRGGAMARTGTIHPRLLEELNQLDYYKKTYPKSLGFEWVKQEVFPLLDGYDIEITDVLRTYVEHCALQIAVELNKKPAGKVLVTGGGAYHTFLMERIAFHSVQQVEVPSNLLVEFKEALIFAFLGILRLRGETNCLSSVTGASRDHSSGKIYHPVAQQMWADQIT